MMPNGEALTEDSATTCSPQISHVPRWFLSYSLERVVYVCTLSPFWLQLEAASFTLWGNLPSFPSPHLVIWNLGCCQSPALFP